MSLNPPHMDYAPVYGAWSFGVNSWTNINSFYIFFYFNNENVFQSTGNFCRFLNYSSYEFTLFY